MFHIHNSTVCLSFWWLPHIRLMNNAWSVVFFFFIFKHIYIHSSAQLAKSVQECFWLFLHCCRHAPKHLGIHCIWKVGHWTFFFILLPIVLTKKVDWSTKNLSLSRFSLLIIFNMKNKCQKESKVRRDPSLDPIL